MPADLLTHRGGQGEPVVLVHGLMGRGSTWSRQLPWLTRLGAVYTYDAPWHRGRDVDDPHPISTERFVADLGDAVAALEHRSGWSGIRWAACIRGVWPPSGPSSSRRWSSRTWRRTSSGAPPARGSRGCIRSRSNSIPPKRYSPNSGRSPASTSWTRSTAPQPGGGCTATPHDGSRSPPNGEPATTGRNGVRCVYRCCSSRQETRSPRRPDA